VAKLCDTWPAVVGVQVALVDTWTKYFDDSACLGDNEDTRSEMEYIMLSCSICRMLSHIAALVLETAACVAGFQ
jgi:hypothetical protein